MEEPDFTQTWSSDGDSVSTDSISSASNSDAVESQSDSTRSLRLLKRAGVFSREEVIEQAIDRWSLYLRLCRRALTSLRESMVESYVKHAIEAKYGASQTGLRTETLSASLHASLGSQRDAHKQRALRRFGRYSSRVENARRAATMSTFAIMSTRLAPWKRSAGVGQHACKYRDPTTTTWESRCTRACLPLLPYCAAHLVLATDKQLPPPPPLSTTSGASASNLAATPFSTGAACDADAPDDLVPGMSTSKHGKPPRKNTLSRDHGGSSSASLFGDIQLPPQFLFRQCGGGPALDCEEPVIAWTPTSRCPRHQDIDSLWPLPLKIEDEPGTSTSDHPAAMHSLLTDYLQKRHRQMEDGGGGTM